MSCTLLVLPRTPPSSPIPGLHPPPPSTTATSGAVRRRDAPRKCRPRNCVTRLSPTVTEAAELLRPRQNYQPGVVWVARGEGGGDVIEGREVSVVEEDEEEGGKVLLKCKITSVVSRLAWLLPLTLSPRQPSYDGASVCLMVCECASAGSLCAPVRVRARACACVHASVPLYVCV